jgi:energy-coupling factor transporter ATP-binding protein EcfA2
MRIRTIHTSRAGPLGTRSLDLSDPWTDQIAPRVLLSGPNGSGKSWMLRAISGLWGAFGHWLHTRRPLAARAIENEWLRPLDGFALVLDDLPFGETPLILIIGSPDFVDDLAHRHQEHALVGERVSIQGNGRAPGRELVWQPANISLEDWDRTRTRMLVSALGSGSPNLVFLDAEERRWVTPRRGLGEISPEDLHQRWLASYCAGEQWEGQLEASLLALKAAAPERFLALVGDMNAFLADKEILTDVLVGENRIRVRLGDRQQTIHRLDDLSAGEHQVLIQLYMIGRWLEPGGIVLIDEPDLHLHPSLIPGLLSRLEQMVAERNGQLMITSHVPEIWTRYESIGRRIQLGAAA